MDEALTPDQIDADFAPRLREQIATVPVESEALLYEEADGTMHQLNPTAAAVCSLFDGQVTLGTLIEDLAAVFDGDRQQIERDVLEMTRDLGRKGLLAGVIGAGEDATDAVDGGSEHGR